MARTLTSIHTKTNTRISFTLPVMSGEGNGLGAPGLLAGFLGKVQERASSLENCPWCAVKGQTRALRSYRISFQKSITLCTEPQCLFPLVSRPLEDVLASLTPPLIPSKSQSPIGGKRKSPSSLENPPPKRGRSVDSVVSQNGPEPPGSSAPSELTVTNGCFVQQKRIVQSEPTDAVDINLTRPDAGQVGAGGYHKDSDWPMPEKVQDVDGVFCPDEGLPVPGVAWALPALQVTVSPVEKRKIQPSPEKFTVVSPLKEALPAPQACGSATEKALASEAVVGGTLQVPEEEKATSTLQNTVSLLVALTAPATPAHINLQTDVPSPEDRVSVPVESKPAPNQVVSTTQVSVSALHEAVTLLKEVLPTPGEAVAMQEEVLPTPGEAVPALKEVLPTPREAVAMQEEVLPTPGEAVAALKKVLPTPREAVAMQEEVLPTPGEDVPVLEEVLPTPGEAVPALKEVLPTPGEAVAMQEEVFSNLGEDVPALKEVLPTPGEADAMLEEVLPTPGEDVPVLEEVLPTPGEAVAMLEEVLPTLGQDVTKVERVLSSPGMAFAAVETDGEEEEALLEDSQINKELLSPNQRVKQQLGHFKNLGHLKNLAEEVATPVMSTLASAGDEKVLPALVEDKRELASESADEKIALKEDDYSEEIVFYEDQERPLEVVCRPCSVDLSQNNVSEDYFAAKEYAEEDLTVFGTEDAEGPLQVVCRPCSVDLTLSKMSDEEDDCDDGPVQARRKQRVRQLVSSEEEGTVEPPPKKKKKGRPRKIPKYTPEVIPDFEPEGISEEQLVSVPGPHLFWKNENSLCWLDSLLVALVHCNTLKNRRATSRSGDVLPVWDLCERYDKASSLITAYQQTGTDNQVTVPSRLLRWVQMEMQAIRMSIFNLLQPLLKCKLGQKETPVFALPLLVQVDAWAEPLFQHAFEWQFKCTTTTCHHTINNKCEKTLTTFTKVVPDWHPLNATHQSRCCKCRKNKQTRKLVLESLAPVFALHFVEGLPDNDVSIYSFTFQQHKYSVSTVIQYDQKLRHFVTWIRQANGSWLEFDDLKYPSYASYTQLVVPPKEIHVVFWELEANRLEVVPLTPSCPRPQTPTSTPLIQTEQMQPCYSRLFAEKLTDLPQTISDAVPVMESTIMSDTTLVNKTDASAVIPPDAPVKPQALDLSLSSLHDETAIVEALTVSENSEGDVNSTVTTVNHGNTTIGSTTLLDTFEGLSHDDIVTLTLVEVPVDSEGRTLDVTAAGLDGCVRTLRSTSEAGMPPAAPEITPSSPGSPQPAFEMTASTHEIPSLAHGLVPHSKINYDNVPARPTSPDTASGILPDRSSESGDASPLSCRNIRRSTRRTKKPSKFVVAPAAKVTRSKTLLAEAPTPKEEQQPPAPDDAKCSTNSTGLAPPLEPSNRWTYLLSRHPGQVPTTSPSTQTMRPQVNQLSPPKPRQHQKLSQSRQPPNMAAGNSVTWRKKAPPPVKPSLRKEESESLLLKPAETYAGFQARSRDATNDMNVSSRTSPPAQRNPPVLTYNTTTSARPVLPACPGVTERHLTTSSRKCGPGSHDSKVSGTPTDTESLRLKLLKKLKAKKRKLEILNQMLGDQVGGGEFVTPGPKSTDLRSPVTVSSSTAMYDSPQYQEFFADLLSPATTASNLSPDSTGFLDMLATNGQEGGVDLACGGNVMGGASLRLSPVTVQQASHAVFLPQPGLDGPITSCETFLDRLMSEPANRQTDMEAEAFNALELFC
ncbi:hypothetical protein UPYG_G00127930 [Umbra pygmaea]|uniref:USP domain-containing protein n=1 Tax=Umbra pygmaea TaxID=75934 RepID=A0ABD0XRI7_UMBPY